MIGQPDRFGGIVTHGLERRIGARSGEIGVAEFVLQG
jgi:hypothetical protein